VLDSLYAVEAEAKTQGLTGTDLAAYRRERAGPVLQSFADWLAQEVPGVLPKSKIVPASSAGILGALAGFARNSPVPISRTWSVDSEPQEFHDPRANVLSTSKSAAERRPTTGDPALLS
jgi:hypothetical protein